MFATLHGMGRQSGIMPNPNPVRHQPQNYYKGGHRHKRLNRRLWGGALNRMLRVMVAIVPATYEPQTQCATPSHTKRRVEKGSSGSPPHVPCPIPAGCPLQSSCNAETKGKSTSHQPHTSCQPHGTPQHSELSLHCVPAFKFASPSSCREPHSHTRGSSLCNTSGSSAGMCAFR
eukprot:jgi/Ulvmu1/10321/UM061_0004.1